MLAAAIFGLIASLNTSYGRRQTVRAMENKPFSDAEFDAHANDYEAKVQASLPELLSEGDYFTRYKVQTVVEALKSKLPQVILDFGCGVGELVAHLDDPFLCQLWQSEPGMAKGRQTAITGIKMGHPD